MCSCKTFRAAGCISPFSINLSSHSLSLPNFSLNIRNCCSWQSSLARCSFGVNACLTKSKNVSPNAMFFTRHKTTHKEIQGQLRLKWISKVVGEILPSSTCPSKEIAFPLASFLTFQLAHTCWFETRDKRENNHWHELRCHFKILYTLDVLPFGILLFTKSA